MAIKGKKVNEGKALFALGWGGCVSKVVCHKYPNEKTTFKMSLPSQKEGEPERTCLIPLQLPPIYPFPILPHSTFQYTSVLFCFLPSDQQVPPNISIFSIQCNIFLFTNKTLSYKMELFNFTVKSFKVIIRVILSELNIAKWK